MNLSLNLELARNYKSKSQIARVLTESWVKRNAYCLNCQNTFLSKFKNNRPVADFYCKECSEEFELKSKSGKVGRKIPDGAYTTMIERINSNNNPHFFFLAYDKEKWSVESFMLIPNYYFVDDMIEKRKPLGENARRAGWVGCNINLMKVPESGKIYIVNNSKVIPKENVFNKWKSTHFLKEKTGSKKGWLLDVMTCIDEIPNENFSLRQVYAFEERLQLKYPNNSFVKDKIRQQLQFLRDKGLIQFVSRGKYKKIRL